MSGLAKIGLQILRYISLSFDMVVYSLIRIFYNLFDAVSQVRVLEDGVITEIADRIYAIIGVYAIFKVVFVLISMMVNPDEAAKGNNSAGKVAVRIVVMLGLIIVVPWVFQKAYQLQNAIIKENVIGQIILGNTTVTDDNKGLSAEYGDTGQNISNQIFSGFVTMNELAINPDVDEDKSDSYLNDDAKSSCSKSYNALLNLRSVVDEKTPTTQGISSVWTSMGETFDSSESGKDEFCLDYKMFLSTIAGGVAAYMFIVYCLDIGLRVIKLAFYQLIAPIPIASYIDGKKDGPFQKWTKSCLMEYADIFLRLVIIYTVIFLISKVDSIIDFSMLNGATGLFARVVVILGMLMFAKQAPQLIMDMFGVKGSGRFSLNASEKLSKAGKVGTLMGGGLAAAGVMAAGGAGMLAGGAGAAGKELFSGIKNKDKAEEIKKNMKDAFSKQANIRGKAAGAEALARLQSKNYNDKGKFNRSTLASDLRRQAFTGNVNATHGIGGRLASAQSDIMSSLSYETTSHKPAGLRMTGLISAQLGNVSSSLSASRLALEERARQGKQDAIDQLSIATDFNAKKVFETYLKKTAGIDPTYQNLPSPNDDAKWKELAESYMNFEKQDFYINASQAEKEAIRNYAEKSLGDLKKEVDTLTKNKG